MRCAFALPCIRRGDGHSPRALLADNSIDRSRLLQPGSWQPPGRTPGLVHLPAAAHTCACAGSEVGWSIAIAVGTCIPARLDQLIPSCRASLGSPQTPPPARPTAAAAAASEAGSAAGGMADPDSGGTPECTHAAGGGAASPAPPQGGSSSSGDEWKEALDHVVPCVVVLK
eukprot:365888-Chlamydomonas_euryale.AAC.6